MTQCVLTGQRSLSDYTSLLGEEYIEQLRASARPLAGARVLHLNATAVGGGVAELLKALVPLLSDLGLNAEWRILRGADEFYKVTKAMHNGLQGMPLQFTPEMKAAWLKYNTLNAELLSSNGSYDFVVVHDPQPAGVLQLLRQGNGHQNTGIWIWRCHIDLTTPQPHFWEFLKPYVELYDAAIFTRKQYFPRNFRGPRCFTAAPGIDPLSSQNRLLGDEEVHRVLVRCGVDPARPFIFMLSRFDPWKDFCGVIDVFDVLKREFPDLQLVLMGGGADDDPETQSCYQNIVTYAGDRSDTLILWGQNGVSSPGINAFQQAASVVVQKSIREGFGLVVSEALWKGCPVVGSDVGGISLQVLHNRTGFLAKSLNEWVESITGLLRDRQTAYRLGSAGRRRVQKRFLVTRYLHDYLRIFQTLADRVQ